MPKHFAVDENIQSGTAYASNVLVVDIVFARPFAKKPTIQLTPGDDGSFPIYKASVTATGFKIRFKVAWTGEVDWVATERK